MACGTGRDITGRNKPVQAHGHAVGTGQIYSLDVKLPAVAIGAAHGYPCAAVGQRHTVKLRDVVFGHCSCDVSGCQAESAKLIAVIGQTPLHRGLAAEGYAVHPLNPSDNWANILFGILHYRSGGSRSIDGVRQYRTS